VTDWIEHTTDTCPVDPETVVEVRWVGSGTAASRPLPAIYVAWKGGWVSHYRIFISAKPPEPEGKEIDPRGTQMWIERQPDLITLRLECMKMAVNDHFYEAGEPDYEQVADRFLHYVLNGSVDKA
jgi:hypothetical protein